MMRSSRRVATTIVGFGLLIILCWITTINAANPSGGATADSPNGTAVFMDNSGTHDDSLSVNSKGDRLKPVSAKKLRGEDSQIIADKAPSPDSGPAVHVADVSNRHGDSAYSVTGDYVGGGGGGGGGAKSPWTATFLTDTAQISLSVSSDPIAPGADSAAVVTVTLAGGQSDRSYPVTLTSEARTPTTSPVGAVSFGSNPVVTLDTKNPSGTLPAIGGASGYLKIVGTCSRAVNSPTSQPATVVGVEKVIVDGSSPEVTGTAYTPVNKSITLRATTRPVDSRWPDGWPKWTCTKPDGSTVDLAQGSPTATTQPTDPGDYVVKATCGSSQGQITVTALRLQLKSITFSGSAYKEISKDTTGTYSGPHWQDNNGDGDAEDTGERRYPVAYVHHNKVTITANYALEPAGATPTGLVLKGDGPGSCSFPETAMTVASGAASATIESSQPLDDKVSKTDFGVTWKFRLSPSTDWIAGGQSSNRLYTLLGNPISGSTLYETVVDIACRNAGGANDESGVIGGFWGDFSGPTPGVKRKDMDGDNVPDGVEMKYWHNYATTQPSQHLPEMLSTADGNGSCLAWSQCLMACFQVHGISGITLCEITPLVGDGFCVKNWTFGQHIRTGDNGLCESTTAGDDRQLLPATRPTTRPTTLPALSGAVCVEPGNNCVLETAPQGDDIPVDGVLTTVVGNAIYRWGHDTDCLSPIPGQGNNNPPPAFANHYVVKYDSDHNGTWDRIYDPSYGAGPFSTELQHENAACDGVRGSGNSVKKKVSTTQPVLRYNP